jgi:hypothetical protein
MAQFAQRGIIVIIMRSNLDVGWVEGKTDISDVGMNELV